MDYLNLGICLALCENNVGILRGFPIDRSLDGRDLHSAEMGKDAHVIYLIDIVLGNGTQDRHVRCLGGLGNCGNPPASTLNTGWYVLPDA